MTKKIRKILRSKNRNHIIFKIVILLFFLIPSLYLSISKAYFSDSNFQMNIAAGALTQAVSLLLLMILFEQYVHVTNRKQEVSLLFDNINYLRNKRNHISSQLTLQYIIRLNQLEITEINLSQCYLINEKIDEMNLTRSNLTGLTMKNCRFERFIVQKSICSDTKFLNAILLKGDFSFATLIKCDFIGTNLRRANFSNATLNNVVFDDAILGDAVFTGAIVENVDFTKAKEFSEEMLAGVKSVVNVKLPTNT